MLAALVSAHDGIVLLRDVTERIFVRVLGAAFSDERSNLPGSAIGQKPNVAARGGMYVFAALHRAFHLVAGSAF
jgi:hypothetical protein